uniref:Uncharacterized protein n=1 Tax=Arundo donax TaxID=35708 RepID=A0A0A8YHV4_ARUDO
MRISELFFSLPTTTARIFFAGALVCEHFTRCLNCFLLCRQ